MSAIPSQSFSRPPGFGNPPGPPPRRLGEALVDSGLITQVQLDEALRLQSSWGSKLGDIVLARGWIRALPFFQALAKHIDVPFVNLMQQPGEPGLIEDGLIDEYGGRLYMPWRHGDDGHVIVANANPGPEMDAMLRQRYGDNVQTVVTSTFDIQWLLQRFAGARITDRALNALAEQTPQYSARTVFTGGQIAVAWLLMTLLVAALAVAPIAALIVINGLATIALLAIFILKARLAWVGSTNQIDIKVTKEDLAALDDPSLPTYTILVPMYKEADMLPVMAGALRRMDYPLSKLDIKLILEEDDTETIDAAKRLGLESMFEIIRVPPSEPKTKPKACNYALAFARGEFVTIFDAEDLPEANQLKKAVAAFRKSDPDVACIQARLNYYNASENWLTRMFTLEYTLWFDFFLPALEKLRIPIPLGGTSNHFRTATLRGLNAWDPHNVTEDADLGVRMTQSKLRVGLLNSTTYEEANLDLGNWLRQRSRWIKGYMQTYLVHMRDPVHLYRSIGARGFLGFQFFIGGTFFAALIGPPMWIIYFIWAFTDTRAFDPIFPSILLYLSLFNLLVGNGLFIYLTMLAAFKRRLYKLAPYAFTVPAYWIMQSIAGYRALWQLIAKPFYWEKTVHGLSRHVPVEPNSALERR